MQVIEMVHINNLIVNMGESCGDVGTRNYSSGGHLKQSVESKKKEVLLPFFVSLLSACFTFAGVFLLVAGTFLFFEGWANIFSQIMKAETGSGSSWPTSRILLIMCYAFCITIEITGMAIALKNFVPWAYRCSLGALRMDASSPFVHVAHGIVWLLSGLILYITFHSILLLHNMIEYQRHFSNNSNSQMCNNSTETGEFEEDKNDYDDDDNNDAYDEEGEESGEENYAEGGSAFSDFGMEADDDDFPEEDAEYYNPKPTL